MEEIIKEENINIEKIIYEVRGVQVMLDSDLAKLYQCTKHPCRWDCEFPKGEFKELNVKSIEE